jgi:hypothetical protein
MNTRVVMAKFSAFYCQCETEDRSKWKVMQRYCNHSAFNGYRETPSAYSSVTCTGCGRVWRTKAKYVDQLGDYQR